MEYMHLEFDPIAFTIGSFPIRWYALAYLAGFLIGWRYCLGMISKEPNAKPNSEDIDDFLTWAIIGVILGGRLGYVLFYQFDYYQSNPSEILQIWRGGMSFHGGMFGVFLSMVWFAKRRKIRLLRLSDLICTTAPIGLFFGRISNFINGELYGRTTELPIGVVFPASGDGLPRHPSQIYEALLEGLLLFCILHLILQSKRFKTGTATGVFLIGYGLFRSLVEFVREPDPQLGMIWDVISMGQILCLPMILVGFIIVFMASRGKFTDKQDNA